MALKKSRLTSSNPYPDPKKSDFFNGEKPSKTKETKVIDTNAGFFIDEEEFTDPTPGSSQVRPAPVIEPDRPKCLECSEEIADSYLFQKFDYEVCDKCRDTEKDGKHELITKTDAKNEFLLKDLHFEVIKKSI